MPRGTATKGRSARRQLQGKARQVLKRLAQEVRVKESELRRLRDDEAKLAALAGQRIVSRCTANGTNWATVE